MRDIYESAPSDSELAREAWFRGREAERKRAREEYWESLLAYVDTQVALEDENTYWDALLAYVDQRVAEDLIPA